MHLNLISSSTVNCKLFGMRGYLHFCVFQNAYKNVGHTFWKTRWQFFKNLNTELPSDPAIHSYTQENWQCTFTKMCTQVFRSALFIIAKNWKQSPCPSSDEWINQMWYIHTKDYCLTIKRNEILIHTTTWMTLESTMLSERSPTQKAIYVIPFI